MKETLDRIASWTALISGTFFIVGIFRAMLYYYFPFGIPIHTYIEFSEIFTIWFPDTIYSCFGAAVFSLLTLVIWKLGADSKENYYFIIVAHVLHIIAIFYAANACFNLMGSYSQQEWEFMRTPYTVIFVMSMICVFVPLAGLIFSIKVIYGRRSERELERNWTFALVSAFFVSVYVFLYSIYTPSTVEMSPDHAAQYVEIIGKQDTIRTNDNLRYIGKTRNYIFLWDKKMGKSRSPRLDDYPEISFSERPFDNLKKK